MLQVGCRTHRAAYFVTVQLRHIHIEESKTELFGIRGGQRRATVRNSHGSEAGLLERFDQKQTTDFIVISNEGRRSLGAHRHAVRLAISACNASHAAMPAARKPAVNAITREASFALEARSISIAKCASAPAPTCAAADLSEWH